MFVETKNCDFYIGNLIGNRTYLRVQRPSSTIPSSRYSIVIGAARVYTARVV